MNILYKHIFLNFGVISFTNKGMVSFFQLHTYEFDDDCFKVAQASRHSGLVWPSVHIYHFIN